MAVVDDYLEIRPEVEPRLRALAQSGRLAMGPWYALPDEFLVSGETLIRNLQHGMSVADRFAGAMEVGYLPDMFGHVAQMPQLFRQFGFEHAVVWRGVAAAIDRTGFWWVAPDGSTVRAEYLPLGYGNGANTPDDAKALLRRIGEFEEEQGELLDGPILWMTGTDHFFPQPWLGRVVAEANAVDDSPYELHICSLAEHVASAPTEDLPRWTGELRSGARANLLMGVASNRLDVKQAAAIAERSLERLAEPLSALFLPADAWPGALLRTAWVEMLRNSAHDSICACSADAVCDAVLHRYAEATHIADGLIDRAILSLAATIEGDDPIVINASARTRRGLVELRLPGNRVPEGCQLVDERPAQRIFVDDTPVEIATIMVSEFEYVRTVRSFVIETLDGVELLYVEREESGSLVTPPVRGELESVRESHAGARVRVRINQRPAVTVLAHVSDVPGFGWQSWPPFPASSVEPVVARPLRLSNGLVSVQVDPTTGTFAIGELTGLGAFLDGGDVGDTYNWCPPDEDEEIDSAAHALGTVSCRLMEQGPLRARLQIRQVLTLPTHVADGRRTGHAPVTVRTTLELRAGEDLVRVQVSFDNHGLRDHRLRMRLPLPRPASTSLAECAFATVERGLTAEGGLTEVGIPTFPSRRFVAAGGLTVAHEGLLEYELIDVRPGTDGDAAHALAITLLRCTGMLSQGPMVTRPLPAGPLTPLEGPQQQGRVEARLALHVGDRDPYAVVDDAFLPLAVTRAGHGARSRNDRALDISGAEVSAVVRDAQGALQVRVFNPSAEPTTVLLPGRQGALVDLRGRIVGGFDGSFALRPWGIATAVLD
jgi:alpha-mannosidase